MEFLSQMTEKWFENHKNESKLANQTAKTVPKSVPEAFDSEEL